MLCLVTYFVQLLRLMFSSIYSAYWLVHKILFVSELLHNSMLIFMLPELFQVSLMQMKQDYGLT